MRHIISLSGGGKDSTALAVYMKLKHPEIPFEYFFADTKHEAVGTYEYVDALEQWLIDRTLDHMPKPYIHREEHDMVELIKKYKMLPSHHMRFCTRVAKVEAFDKWVGDDECQMYVGIRWDEWDRIKSRRLPDGITPVYPFIDDKLEKDDILQILNDNGLPPAEFYKYRSRSGCYFCFYQRRIEWVLLLENFPDKFAEAEELENTYGSEGFTWIKDLPLSELRQKADKIKARYQKQLVNGTATYVYAGMEPDPDAELQTCGVCHI